MVGLFVGWLVGLLVGWLVGWLVVGGVVMVPSNSCRGVGCWWRLVAVSGWWSW